MTKYASASMARSAVILVFLLVFGPARHRADRATAESAPIPELARARWIEPRLTGATAWARCTRSLPAGRVLEEVDCGTPHELAPDVSLNAEVCETLTTTHAETLRTLITHPDCTTAAIDRLAELARDGKDARLTSDLAAAYYVRARRDDQPSDLLRSLEAAQRAVKIDAALPAAQFNLALAQDSLGFPAASRDSWKQAARLDDSQWSDEAAAHQTEIERAAIRGVATQWSLNRRRLPEAVSLRDRATIETLIKPYPAAAQRYLEEEVLPAWGAAFEQHRSDDAHRLLGEASAIAAALGKLTGDPYLREIVQRVESSQGARLRLLARGHVAFGEARARDLAHDIQPAAAAYAEAARAFARTQSPLRAGAELGQAIQESLITRDKAPHVRKLTELEPVARKRGYLNLWARVQSNRANFQQIEGYYLEALDLYDAALQTFQRMNDEENLANVHVRKAGIFRVLGHDEAALRETFLARRYAGKLLELRFRHLLAGETAATALALGFPQTALMYQSALVDELFNDLANAPSDEKTKQGLRFNLAIALRARASIRLHLGDRETARVELDQASGMSQWQGDEKIRNALQARIAEVKGEEALPANPKAAMEAFTKALALSGPIRYRTFQTILLMRRAEAYRRAGLMPQAKQDMSSAIEELNAEETELLAGRRRGAGEGLWSDYFSRFQESYQLLIEQLLAEKQKSEAFAYSERSRAFEPLKLVLDLPSEATKSLDTRSADLKTLPEIRAVLGPTTFMLEYQVGDRQTFVWILSHDDFDEVTLPVGRESIEGWIRSLQRDAVDRDAAGFDALLTAPFAALLRAPIERLERMNNGHVPNRRLVIIPHRIMQGFPFSALRNPKTNRYLVQDFSIATAASATLYVLAMERDRKLASETRVPKALLIGDPAFDQSLELAHGLKRLRFARMEAESAGKFYEPHATVLVDVQATVPAFLEQSRDSDIVHIAGHAIANPHAPFGTLLLMAPSANNTGLLYEEELLTKLRLENTRLVVLAACSSAGGMPVGPEGLAPLVRPIIAAGVPGVIGSLWTINDAASERLLVEFHRYYRDGRDAASALQLAQIHFLNEQNPAIPVFAWSAFQVVGQASSPFAH
jgi:CHAT domain-containing protein